MISTCKVDGCASEAKVGGLCRSHHNKKYYSENKERILKTNKDYYFKNKERLGQLQKKARQSVDGRWKHLQYEAKRDRRMVSISKSEFEIITSQLCLYCGGMSPGKNFVGIDRLDSSRGYEVGNVVPCCTRCNMMKGDQTLNDWFSHMEKILTFSGRSAT